MSVQDKLDRIETMEDLFDLTIDIAKRSVLVSSLAYVESVNEGDKYSVVTVKPFPLMKDQTEYTINAYCNNDLAEDLSVKDIVVVLFTDLDFRSSLNNNSIDAVNDDECHDINNGVIVGYLYKSKGK